MDLNLILFPAPKCSYHQGQAKGEIIWIPKFSANQRNSSPEQLRQQTAPNFERSTGILSYDTALLKVKNTVTVADAVSKPQCKEIGLDDVSIMTAASSKKPNRGEKVEFQDENSANLLYRMNLSENGDSDVTDNKHLRNEVNRNLMSCFTQDRDCDFIRDSVICIEEPIASIIPSRFISNKSSHVESPSKLSVFMTHDDPKRLSKSFKPKPDSSSLSFEELFHPTEPAKNKMTTPQVSMKNSKITQNNLTNKLSKLISQKAPKSKIQPSVILRDQSLSSFDPNFIDENDETRPQILTSPRSMLRYGTKLFTNPIAERIREKLELDMQLATSEAVERTELSSNAPTARAYATENGINPFVQKQKRKINTGHILSPTPKVQKENRVNQPNKAVSLSMNLPNLKELRPPNGAPLSASIRPTAQKAIPDAYIPCMLLRSGICTSKIMIYFHGNGEDINLAYDLLSHIRNNLNINVLAVEYPGYGLYKGTADEAAVLADSEIVFDFLVQTLKISPRDIIIFGRSIGSGPATYLASKKNAGALVLMSAFTSIRAVVKDIAGKWAQFLIKERFNNLEAIKKVTCPAFIVHGQKDRLIPYNHSEQLHDSCKAASELLLPKNMNHIEFDFFEDFTSPLIQFLERCGMKIGSSGGRIFFPKRFFEMPEHLKPQKKPVVLTKNKKEHATVSVTVDLFAPVRN